MSAAQILARTAFLALITAAAALVAWRAPAGTPLMGIVAVGSLYALARLTTAEAGRVRRAGGAR